jgi:TonB family protein
VQARPQVETKRPSLNLSDALKDIELPPEAPKLADIAPAEAPRARATASPAPSQNEVSKLLSGLNVPEPVAPSLPTPTAEKAGPVRPAPSRPTIDPELQRKLEQLQRPIERSAPAAAPPPVVASKPAPVRRVRPVTAQNAGPGSNEYLALVQRLISQGWFPPKVDVATDTMEVILRFRLNRDGRITDVVVEEQSGNDYYDDSARRAVLSAQVPAFRSDMAVPFLDVHFSFSVGQQNG